jgi:hypothetical protein
MKKAHYLVRVIAPLCPRPAVMIGESFSHLVFQHRVIHSLDIIADKR